MSNFDNPKTTTILTQRFDWQLCFAINKAVLRADSVEEAEVNELQYPEELLNSLSGTASLSDQRL